MKTRHKITILMMTMYMWGFSQNRSFHTLNIPDVSPQVVKMQRLGVTEITIRYNSPDLRGRDVWNDTNIIPKNGDPIAWRAGANMNTTIEFSTDVMINDNKLSAGKYGFHVIPKDDGYTILFAHSNHLWGSYYLDLNKDISLTIDIEEEECDKAEYLDYKFLERSSSSVVIGLDWDEKRLPFTVKVDLNETVVSSFRKELRGINTYRWEAWNDAANWCLTNNTNLEEALEWANRSISGGYHGFGADKNMTNLATKSRILKKLGRENELNETIGEALNDMINATAYDYNGFIIFLLRNGSYQEALKMSDKSIEIHPSTWYLELNKAIALYFTKGKETRIDKLLDSAYQKSPENFKKRILEIKEEIKSKTYKI